FVQMEKVRLINIQGENDDLHQIYRDALTKDLATSLKIEFLLDIGNIQVPEKYLIWKEVDEKEVEFLKNTTTYILSLVYAYRGFYFGNNLWERKDGFITKLFSMENKFYRDKAIIGSINFLKKE